MATFEAIEKYSSPEEAKPQEKESPEEVSQRAVTVKEDIEKSSVMLKQLEDAIRDTPPTSTMLPKLVNAYVALSNMRDVRAKVADEIIKGIPSDAFGRLGIEQLIHESLLHRDPSYRRAYEIAHPEYALEPLQTLAPE